MKLEVPYYSQYLDVDDTYWMPRACGMACLKMVLDYHGKETPSLLEKCKKGKQDGGYSPFGWYHEYILKVARGYGLQAERGEKIGEIMGLQRILDELRAGNPVIVSVSKQILGQQKFHMVVITGHERNEEGKISGFYFHEPESLDRERGSHVFVDVGDFKNDWRRMAIFISPIAS